MVRSRKRPTLRDSSTSRCVITLRFRASRPRSCRRSGSTRSRRSASSRRNTNGHALDEQRVRGGLRAPARHRQAVRHARPAVERTHDRRYWRRSRRRRVRRAGRVVQGARRDHRPRARDDQGRAHERVDRRRGPTAAAGAAAASADLDRRIGQARAAARRAARRRLDSAGDAARPARTPTSTPILRERDKVASGRGARDRIPPRRVRR